MKNIYVIISLTLIFFMLLLPLLSLSTEAKENVQNIAQTGSFLNVEASKSGKIKVKISESGEIKEIDEKDYILGVLAAEMSAESEAEALKAQAVAAYSFMLVRKSENAAGEYDITDSYLTDQHYIDEQKQNEKWGEKAAENREKLKKIVNSVAGEYLCFDGKPALALYHAISGGKTESALDVYGKEYPYLISCDSLGDLFAAGYQSTAEVTAQEFCQKLGVNENDIKKIELSCRPNGYIDTLKIGEKSFSGRDIRTAFSLRSANFQVNVKDDKVIFSVCGYGHGVGMSQAGACYLAAQGSTYKEILLWYYKGCTIEKSA